MRAVQILNADRHLPIIHLPQHLKEARAGFIARCLRNHFKGIASWTKVIFGTSLWEDCF